MMNSVISIEIIYLPPKGDCFKKERIEVPHNIIISLETIMPHIKSLIFAKNNANRQTDTTT